MAQNILERWKKGHNNSLPKTIFYYRPLDQIRIPMFSVASLLVPGDGVSDGQFVNVLTLELNLLMKAFKKVDVNYNPQLVIIVGQKRHQTRLWMEQGEKGKGKAGSADINNATIKKFAMSRPKIFVVKISH